MSSKTSAMKMHKCRGTVGGRGKSGKFSVADTAKLTAHWETRLKRMGLGMDAGHNRSIITYGHMVADRDWDGKVTYEPPTGERLEDGEWLISLC